MKKQLNEIDWKWEIKKILWRMRWPLKATSSEALDECLIATGVVFPRRQEARDVFYEKGSTKKSLEKVLVKATDNQADRDKGRKAFWKDRKPILQTFAAFMAFMFVLTICFVPAKMILPNNSFVKNMDQPLIYEGMSRAEAAAVKLLFDAGWKDYQYKATVAKHAAAATTQEPQAISAVPVGGQGAYNPEGVFTIEDMVEWLGSKDPAAKTIVAAFEKNGVTRAQVLDVNNWVIITAEVAYRYPENTAYRNGKIIPMGDREGKAGEIFFMFILPDNSGISVRAACGNPQNDTPTPLEPRETTTHREESTTLQMPTTTVPTTRPEITTVTSTNPETTTSPPETTTGISTTKPAETTTVIVTTTNPAETTTLHPKDKDPDDYKHPDIKPVVPEVTTPGEKDPSIVDVIVTWVSGIIDTVTNPPGSETGGSAPGVEPTNGEQATRYIPPAETGVNPTNGPTVPGETTTVPANNGTIPNPYG